MKKYLVSIFAIVIIAIMYMPAQAQVSTDSTSVFKIKQTDNSTTASTTLNIAANVESQLTVNKVNDINFGGVVQGLKSTLNPITNDSSSNVGYNATVGEFTIAGQQGANVVVQIPSSTSLSGPGSSLPFTTTAVGDSLDNQGSSTSITTPSATVKLGTSTTGNSGTAANYYIWVGGSLGTIPSGQTAGAYSGSITVNVFYQ